MPTLETLTNVVWSGIWLGSVYGAIGVGLVVSFRAARLINMSLGGIFVFAAMLAAWLQGHNLAPLAAAGIAIVVATAIAAVQEEVLLRRMESVAPSIMLLATLAVAIELSGLAALFFGRDPVTGKGITTQATASVGVWHPQWNAILLVLVVLALTAAVWMFVGRSAPGKAMSAAGDDAGAARMLGFSTWRLRLAGMLLAGLVVGVAGVAFLPLGVVDFTQGLNFTLFGFVAAAITGYESVPGALIGGWIFGLAGALGTAYISSVFSEAVAFGALISLVLLARRLPVLQALSRAG